MQDKMQYLFKKNEQESGSDGWDKIKKKINEYLFEQKVLMSEKFVFDATDRQRKLSRGLSSTKSTLYRSLNVELSPYIWEAQ